MLTWAGNLLASFTILRFLLYGEREEVCFSVYFSKPKFWSLDADGYIQNVGCPCGFEWESE